MILTQEFVDKIKDWAYRCEHQGQGYVIYKDAIDALIKLIGQYKINECTHIIKLDEPLMEILRGLYSI